MYGKTRNCGELLTMERGCADVAALAGFFDNIVDELPDQEALAQMQQSTGRKNWFSDKPVSEYAGITADGKGRITDIDVSVVDPQLRFGDCRLPHLQRMPLVVMDEHGGARKGMELNPSYLEALAHANPGVDISANGSFKFTRTSAHLNGIWVAFGTFNLSKFLHLDFTGVCKLQQQARACRVEGSGQGAEGMSIRRDR